MIMMKFPFLAVILSISLNAVANDQAEHQARTKKILDRVDEMTRSGEILSGGAPGSPSMTQDQIREAVDKATATARNPRGTPRPENEETAKASDDLSDDPTNARNLVDRAYLRFREGAQMQNTAATTAAKTAKRKDLETIDPAEIVKLYNTPQMRGEIAGPKDELLVFISTSMPAETLMVIGAQAKQAGAVLVLRGVPGGFNGKNLKAMMKALKPAADEGADIQIHPELFRRYGVRSVPTTVLANTTGNDCDEGLCTQHAKLVGDVSIEYALEDFSRRRDVLGQIAMDRLEQMRSVR